MLNFKDAEVKISALVENDCNDEQIYQLIHDIAFNYMYNVLRSGRGSYDYDMIAWDLAADLFMRIKKGAKIDHYTNYIIRLIKLSYLYAYEKNNWSVIIDTGNDVALEKAIQTCCVGENNEDIINIENLLTEIYFSQFESIINGVMKNTKFEYNSSVRLNLEISVLLTLNKNEVTCFRIDTALAPYIQIIITQLKNKLILDGVCDRDTYKDIIVNNSDKIEWLFTSDSQT